jgi:hypothetical protein
MSGRFAWARWGRWFAGGRNPLGRREYDAPRVRASQPSFACQSGLVRVGPVERADMGWEADTRGQPLGHVEVRRGARDGPGDSAQSRGVAPGTWPGDVSGLDQVSGR